MKGKIINIVILFLYFIIAIVFLNSIGIWLPIIIDSYNIGTMSPEVYHAVTGNLITYSLGLFLVALVDRVIHLLFKTSKYSSNVLEFFLLIFACIAVAGLVFCSLKSLKGEFYDEAIHYSAYIVIFAWCVWIYVKLQGSKATNFSPIGGIL